MSRSYTKKWVRPEVVPIDHDSPIPETISKTQKIGDVLHFAGVGKKSKVDIMFVASCPLEEELDENTSPPALLKGGPANILRRSTLQAGIDIDKQYYTVLCKYALPRNQKLKPSKKDILRNSKLLLNEIEKIKPKIIVCLGKPAFDFLIGISFKENEAMGCWFDFKHPENDKIRAKLYVSGAVHLPFFKPEYHEKQLIDFIEVNRVLEGIKGIGDDPIPTNYELVQTEERLLHYVDLWKDYSIYSVDCEWAGSNYVDGKLRSIQFCWKVGHAVFIQFYDETGKFCFDCSWERIVQIFTEHFNQDHIRYIGHNFAADGLWMMHHLKLDVWGRCIFDTMFAMQTIDEYADIKLEKLAIRFTDLGRYDIDLLLWKKKAKGFADFRDDVDGYGSVPTDILYPYGCRDVDTPMRCYPILSKMLLADNTYSYYNTIRLPLVTDGFISMSEAGMPIDREDTAEVRNGFTIVREIAKDIFYDHLRLQADSLLLQKLFMVCSDINKAQAHLKDFRSYRSELSFEEAFKKAKVVFGKSLFEGNTIAVLEHWLKINTFKITSDKDKRFWLFEVLQHRPVKTTKSDGMPSVDWDKIEELPPEEQKNYSPAVDKDTLKIYADRGDSLCQELIELNAVSTITRSFLKGENEGVEKLICSDDHVHGNWALTETGRPRCWKPNLLNYPKYVSKQIEATFDRVKNYLLDRYSEDDISIAFTQFREEFVGQYDEEGYELPEKWVEPKPLRWCFKAPENYCFVEADFCTAEVFAIAYLANDRKLIKALTEPDKQFALEPNPEPHGDPIPRRIAYIQDNTDITDDQKDPSLLHDPDDPKWLRDESGNLIHPKRDVHWEMAENRNYMNTPREKLDKDLHRGGGKVGNFSVPYQASPSLLCRSVEILTGSKPEEGTGEKIIEAYASSKPTCWEQLQEWMDLPIEEGFYQGPSGFKRHFKTHGNVDGIPKWMKRKVLEPLRREAANNPMQNIVADTLARAVVGLSRELRERGMKSRVCIPLYDALYVSVYIPEKEEVLKLMRKHMSDENVWDLPGGKLKFNLDFGITKRWACKPTEQEKKEIGEK